MNEVAKLIDNTVATVIGEKSAKGFERAHTISAAIAELKTLLDNDYMKPIMKLQGNRLGFKTDKDQTGGYSMDVVRECLIEAVLTGLQPCGNHFNIIAGNMYVTKEGFGYLLGNFPGLSYEIINALPRIKEDKSGAAVLAKIVWSINGNAQEVREIDLPIKMNNYMGADGVLGKATRKARAWLYNRITGSEISDGDASDNDGKETGKVTIKDKAGKSIDNVADNKERDRIAKHIEDAKTIDELNQVIEVINLHNLTDEFSAKMLVLSNE